MTPDSESKVTGCETDSGCPLCSACTKSSFLKWGVLVAALIVLIISAQWVKAQDAATDKARAETPARSAADAWSELQRTAQKTLGSAVDRVSAAREVLDELTKFADAYSGTSESTIARFNHGALAMAIGDADVAEKSLRKALAETENPALKAAISARLSQLSVRPGSKPPIFKAKSLQGRSVSLKDYKGKVLLIDFWATWCGPCREELPNVKKVYKEYREKGFEILSVSLDHSEDVLKTHVKEESLDWTHIFNGSLPEGADIATQYGVESIPQMILIGRDGRILEVGLRGHALGEAVGRAIGEG